MNKLVALTLVSLLGAAACGDDDTSTDDAGHRKDSGGDVDKDSATGPEDSGGSQSDGG